MNYPFWEVPVVGSQLLIAIIAIIHVFISHFAVGGGLYLPLAETYFHKKNNQAAIEHLKKFTRFFLIVSAVFGAITGVGIWFIIGLANPETTSSLIHTFVFGWAIEWVFFLVEIAALFIYYYGFKFMSRRNHLIIGWIYFVNAWLSLFIINGILTYMLTPGAWLESKNFWDGFFNPTYLPSLLVRTLASFLFAAFYSIFVTARLQDSNLKEFVNRYNSRWALPALFGMIICLAWYYLMLPENAQTIITLGIDNAAQGNFSFVTRIITVGFITFVASLLFLFFGPYLNPRHTRPSIAIVLLLMGFLTIGSFEFAREMLRKPYSISNYIYSNSTRVSQVDQLKEDGILKHIRWTDLKTITPDNKLEVGKEIFRNQCLACHTREAAGYRSIVKLNKDRDREAMLTFINLIRSEDPEINTYLHYMPPFFGTDQEAEALADYMYHLKVEAGMAKDQAETPVEPTDNTPDPAEDDIDNADDEVDQPADPVEAAGTQEE